MKDEKKSRVRRKRLNVLGEEHTKLILFLVDAIRRAQELLTKKEAFAKAKQERINTKKVAQAVKKQKDKAKKAAKALQAVVREENIDKVRIEEKAQLEVQKKKEAGQKKVAKALPVRIKTPAKPKKALVIKKKAVRFVSGGVDEGVLESSAKQSSQGRVIKPRVIFEEGSN